MASTYTDPLVHIIFATKGRLPTLTHPETHAVVGGMIKRLDATPVAVGGVEDHIHLLVRIKPTHIVADLVRETKKATARWLKDNNLPVQWQEGYAAFSVGRHECDAVVSYIHRQKEHHQRESSSDELRRILKECGIDYDPKYFE